VWGDEERFEFCCIELFEKLGCLWPTVFLVAVELGDDATDILDLVVCLPSCCFIKAASRGHVHGECDQESDTSCGKINLCDIYWIILGMRRAGG